MGKAVLISIQPKWCELIANGEKTIEVRKNKPKLETPFRCYIYCTLPKFPHEDHITMFNEQRCFYAGGKVIGEFVCDKILDIFISCSDHNMNGLPVLFTGLTDREIMDYLGNGKTGYGWHISDILIYYKPKNLSEFFKQGTLSAEEFEYQLYDGSGDPRRSSYASYLFTQAIRHPPQSWCYVEGLKEGDYV